MPDSFLQHFEAIEDPRIDRCKRHALLDIIFLAVSAVLSGAECWEQIEDFGSLQIGGEQSFQYMGEQEGHFDYTRGHGIGSKFTMGYQKTQR